MMSIGLFGLVTNMLFTLLVTIVKFGSVQMTAILLLQCILDGWACGSMFMMNLWEEVVQGQKLNHTNVFYKLVYGDHLIWFGTLGSIQNIAYLSFDRYFAVFYPLVYSTHKTNFTIVCTL